MDASWRRQRVCMTMCRPRDSRCFEEKKEAGTEVTRAGRPCLLTQQSSLTGNEQSFIPDSNKVVFQQHEYISQPAI